VTLKGKKRLGKKEELNRLAHARKPGKRLGFGKERKSLTKKKKKKGDPQTTKGGGGPPGRRKELKKKQYSTHSRRARPYMKGT